MYVKARHGKKQVEEREIMMKKDGNHAGRMMASAPARHEYLTHLELRVDANAVERYDYAFKLFSSDLCRKPFFRFDAAGQPHRNRNSGGPLALQRVNTPHFHYHDESGWEIAYQTEALKDPAVAAAIYADINAGARIFCEESNTVAVGDVPFSVIFDDGLFGRLSSEAPLQGVLF